MGATAWISAAVGVVALVVGYVLAFGRAQRLRGHTDQQLLDKADENTRAITQTSVRLERVEDQLGELRSKVAGTHALVQALMSRKLPPPEDRR